MLTTPRLFTNERLGPSLPTLGRPKFSTRENSRRPNGNGGALIGNGKLGQTIDLVTPQVDPDRSISGARIDVDDRPANGDLTSMLDLPLSAAEHDEFLDQLDRVDLITGFTTTGATGFGIDALDQRPGRGDNQRRGRSLQGGAAPRVADPWSRHRATPAQRSVSHAGKFKTRSAPRTAAASAARRSASACVGVPTAPGAGPMPPRDRR